MSFFNTIGRFGRNTRSSAARNKNNNNATSNNNNHHLTASSDNNNNTGFNGHVTPTINDTKQSMQKPLFLCQPFIRSALVKGSFKTIVTLPKYVDLREWVALNLFEFFQHINDFHGVVVEFCTPKTCATMSAGAGTDYTWVNPQRKHIRLPAPQYMDYVMTYISNRLASQSEFPTLSAAQFPPTAMFMTSCRQIYQQMFRVFAHIYWNHFDRIVQLSLEPHYNSFFCHFVSFGKEFDLIDKRDALPLRDLVTTMEQNGNIA